ncbi:cytochrome P450 [Schizophyllum amplum]|uniref:Cytochrome P450 n=1 Tax=Schizophyllum amplum TaxID=97359 RepID=A0A550C8A0_9AGAR|nr:cytochrome P450 [Auriculariopsis ampla]
MSPSPLVIAAACIAVPVFWAVHTRTALPALPYRLPWMATCCSYFRGATTSSDWLAHIQEQYGEICELYLPLWGRILVIGHPTWLQHVKQGDTERYSRGPIAIGVFKEFPGPKTPVASEGAEWRKARKVMAPIFSVKSFTNHISHSMRDISSVTRQLLSNIAAEDGSHLTGKIALEIFTVSCLSVKTDKLRTDPKCLKEDDYLRDCLIAVSQTSRLFNPFYKWTEKLTGESRKFETARAYIRSIVDDVVAKRRATEGTDGVKHGDYLSQILNDPTMRMRSSCATRSGDNTRNSLAWAMHALLQHPDWMEKMREEALANGHFRGPDDRRFPIHMAVFYEVVRLWPGLPKKRGWLSTMMCCPNPGHGLAAVKVNKGDYVLWSDYVMMRNPKVSSLRPTTTFLLTGFYAGWGPDANVFDPSRHLKDGIFYKPGQPDFNGFGSGPRLCPAAQMAAYEFVAIWASLLPHFDFERAYKEEPKMDEAFTVAVAGKLP